MLKSARLHRFKNSGQRAALLSSRTSGRQEQTRKARLACLSGGRGVEPGARARACSWQATGLCSAMTKRRGGDLGDGSKRRSVAKAVGVQKSSGSAGDGAGYDAGTKVDRLRSLLEKGLLSAYIVPTDDPHLCEMPPSAFRRRDYISGFTGSAGTALVTTANAVCSENGNGHASKEKREGGGFALLWTDSRYFLQADMELSETPWKLMKSGMPDVPEPINWLVDNLKPGSRVGIDPMVFTVQTARQFRDQLTSVQCSLIPVEENLVDEVWQGDGRPAFPDGRVRIHPLDYAGDTVSSKLEKVREEMKEEKTGALLVNTLDEVAWLLNIRGADIENSPVVVAYVVVTLEECTLFVDREKLSDEVSLYLKECGVSVQGYGDLKGALKKLCGEDTKFWVDPNQCTSGLYDLLSKSIRERGSGRSNGGASSQVVLKLSDDNGNVYSYNTDTGDITREGGACGDQEIALSDESGYIIEKKSPISMAKAQKNEAEINGLVEAHLRDGVALTQFLEWLEITIVDQGVTPTEYEISEKLLEFRSLQQGFIEPSFATIAGEGENGAIIHYRPEKGSCNTLTDSSMLLLDSGGQFDCGTTDVTRTVHFGEPSDYQKQCYTRVLKGHIALNTLVFPEGVPGFMIDSFARSSLWRGGLDYRHGTGHGVGAGLNVHEGPCGISARYTNTTGICKGMVLSNEPGYYEEGSFGIRIENLVWVSKAETDKEFGDKEYLKFNDLTMVPIQKKLMVRDMLTKEEVQWVNEYHAKVWDSISPRLKSGTTKDWLRHQTTPL
ncbi:creatinase/aminopeptidase [Chloropicon primus]|nr:creatinase/aminopeptidase [Chloropicon primus]